MPNQSRKGEDKLLLALACGATTEAAAQAAGISRSTANRRLKDPEFQRKLQKLRFEMSQRTAGMLNAAGQEFVKRLLELSKPPAPYSVQLGATKAGLELGVKFRESITLEERILALEQKLGAREPDRAA
jgi:hypothetical protein